MCIRDRSRSDCENFFERTKGVLEPFIVDTLQVRSTLGTSTHCSVFAIPFTPMQAVESLRSGEGDWVIDLVNQGVEKARQAGCSIVGFGGYTSIVTRNCRLVPNSDIALTSGNSLTVVAALDALELAANRLGIEKKYLVLSELLEICLLYTSPSPRDATLSRMPSSA